MRRALVSIDGCCAVTVCLPFVDVATKTDRWGEV